MILEAFFAYEKLIPQDFFAYEKVIPKDFFAYEKVISKVIFGYRMDILKCNPIHIGKHPPLEPIPTINQPQPH